MDRVFIPISTKYSQTDSGTNLLIFLNFLSAINRTLSSDFILPFSILSSFEFSQFDLESSSRRSEINLDEIEINRKKILQKIKEKKTIIIENSNKNQLLDTDDVVKKIN
jgi:hypothetical protein